MTYPKVTEIKRCEWEPEQIAATYAEALTAAQDAGVSNPRACAGRYVRRMADVPWPQHPTVCPKR